MKRLQHCILTSLLAILCCTGAFAQQARVSVQMKNGSLEEFFKAVEKQTNYMFSYDENTVSKDKDVTVAASNKPLSEILTQVLSKKGLSYQMISDKAIVILKKSTEKAPVSNSKAITGKVVDAKGLPIIGASVIEKGTSNGVVTDLDGTFSLNLRKAGSSIVVSSIGYVSEEISDCGKNMKIELKEDVLALEGVVVTAMGIVRNTRELSYSTQTFRGDELTAVRTASGNVLDDLKGKIAGADVSSTSAVGGASKVVLRGSKSIKYSQNALIVVDGIPYQDPLNGQPTDVNTVFMGSDGALDINPDDILTVDILKGPSAAALYGSEGANGAIIITTKKGAAGSTKVNYSGSVSLETPIYFQEMQNEYGRGNGGAYGANAAESWGARTDKCEPDNWKEVYTNGYTANNSVSIQSGTEKIQGYFSYTNSQIKGNTKDNKLNKNNFNVRVTSNPFTRLHTDAKVTFTQTDINHANPVGAEGLAICNMIMPRDLSMEELYNYGPIDEMTGQPVRNYWTTSSIFDNPLWIANYMGQDEKRNRIILATSVKFDITPWLNIQGRYGYDYSDVNLESYFYDGSHGSLDASKPGGNYIRKSPKNDRTTMDILLNGNNKFGDFSLTYNLGASKRHDFRETFTYNANGLSSPNKFDFYYATSPEVKETHAESELQSVYATAQVGWRDALYLDATARNDWSSTLPAPYSYFYPSVGLTAILSELIQMPSFVDFAKLRASYSDVGAAADPYQLQAAYSYNATYGYIYPDTTNKTPDLKPEHTKSWEVGGEFQFLNRRLGFDFTYYQSTTTNQLMSMKVAQETGYKKAYVNCGIIENKGFELAINATPVLTPDFSWNTRINLGHNKNELVKLSDTVHEYQQGGDAKMVSVYATEGMDLGRLRAGTWEQDEEGRYVVDADGTPKITKKFTDIGGNTPDYIWGFHNTFRYKSLSLDAQIDGKIGGTMISFTDAYGAYYGVSAITLEHREDTFVLEGTVKADGTPNTTPITGEQFWKKVEQARQGACGFFAYDASFARLRNLALSYDFNFGRDSFVKMAKVSLTGHNLLMLYRGKNLIKIPGISDRKMPFDPEAAASVAAFQGVESGIGPSTRSVGVSVNLTF